MQCLRCNSKMKHYSFCPNWAIFGAAHQPHPFSNAKQSSHNPHSVYVCDNCGYMEFSTKPCEKPDI